jgi:hypothetical protein
MSISDDAPNLVVSGETTLTETLRMISPGPSAGGQRKKTPGNQGPASRPGSKKTATRKLKATASTPAFVRTSFVKEDGDDLLNIAGIFQSIFPDLSENRFPVFFSSILISTILVLVKSERFCSNRQRLTIS